MSAMFTITTTTTTTAKAKKETSIKSNLNSVLNGCTFAALKQHITTCPQLWRQKHPPSTKRNKNPKTTSEHQQQQQEENQCPCQQHSGKWFRKNTHKEFSGSSCTSTSTSFMKRTTVYCKTFYAKLQKVLTTAAAQQPSTSTTIGDREGPHRHGRKVEIVAKLLSSTLIATADSSTSTSNLSFEDYPSQRRDSADSAYHSIQDHLEIFQSSVISTTTTTTTATTVDGMTITDLQFLEIRDEYPDLDSEIRSILTTRAQGGATISNIRDDYRKLTGLTFPVYDSITDFLLSIPYVSAYCNENGTRIFNIRPMEKTKHIHNMVLHQKTPQEPVQKPYNHRRYYREHQRNTNYYPNNWRLNASFRRQQQEQHQYQPKPHQPTVPDPYAVDKENIPVNACNDNNLSRDDSEGFVENNWYYNDNCNYLLNRICNQEAAPPVLSSQMVAHTDLYTVAEHQQQQQQTPQLVVDVIPPLPVPTADFNNFNVNVPTYENNINHLNNIFQMQEHQPIPTNNNMVMVNPRRSSIPFKGSMPRSSRSSSPTAKSCYTNDSMFTDTDYEAHLLDFLLMGDDFFLYMARMELRCKFKKHQKVLQSGLCVSGLTINAAIKRISTLSDNGRSVIVNIGSVNIMQGRQLIQIEHEFRELIVTMLKKGVKPILTTVAPLGNYTHNVEIKRTLERFNQFIKREGERKNLIVIDIWKCLVNEKEHVMFDCFQNEPRNVTGAAESYLFWNNIGRQRVLQLIESQLEY